MNWEHFRAVLWLRWRLRLNQFRRGGIANVVILGLMAAIVIILAMAAFGGCLAGGLALAKASPVIVLLVWDGLVVLFLFFWAIGILSELQRTEALTLTKFLHMPVSPFGIFIINYLSSLFSVNLFLFGPALVGMSLGLMLGRGPIMAILFPLGAAFILMISALTYQFQGWLAILVSNPRRRRTVIVVTTMAFVLITQAPQLINLMRFEKPPTVSAAEQNLLAGTQALEEALARKEITRVQLEERKKKLENEVSAERERVKQEMWQRAQEVAHWANLGIPFGWLPLGAAAATENNILPALLGTLGFTLIGSISLWRSYRTTIQLFTGQAQKVKARVAPTLVEPRRAKATGNLLEQSVPWCSEQATAIALASFRSLLRAPEAKMMLLGPLIMIGVFGTLWVTRVQNVPEIVRPFVATGAMAMVYLTLSQLLCNQFGLDRNGFRVFVLCPAPRREILVGKNLAWAPMILGIDLIILVALQAFSPMRADHFLAFLPQIVSMYLIGCLLGNLVSVLAPMRVAPGTMKVSNPKAIPFLMQMGFVLAQPIPLSLTLIPYAVQILWDSWGGPEWMPVNLILSTLVCVGVVFLYRLVVTMEGEFLQHREKMILEYVTTKEE